jgi:hypothetical protein
MNRAGFLTKILYWSTGNGRVEDYSNNNTADTFYTPIQYYYDKVKYFIKQSNSIIEVNNNYNIHNV